MLPSQSLSPHVLLLSDGKSLQYSESCVVGFVVVMFLSLLFSEKHCNMASIVIRFSNAFISSNNRLQKVLCGGFVLSLESLATLLVHLLNIF